MSRRPKDTVESGGSMDGNPTGRTSRGPTMTITENGPVGRRILELMGQKVVVLREYKRFNLHPRSVAGWNAPTNSWNGREWVAYDRKAPRVGWIVGVTHRAHGYTIEDGYEDPPIFIETGRVKALLVCYWPSQRPVLVPLDGYREATIGVDEPEYGGMVWTEKMRGWARGEAQNAPRDDLGRFRKWVPADSSYQHQS